MYIEAVVGRSLAIHTSNVGMLVQQSTAERLVTALDTFARCILHAVKVAWVWLVHTLPALFIRVFAISAAWTFHAFWSACCFVRDNPHPFHIVGWSIFFGPIILLVPCLLLLELLILSLFHLSSLLHGQAPGCMEDRFDALKEYFLDLRESIFATIEHWTATFNKWTSDYPSLLILRLLGGVMGLVIFVGLYTGWK
ncbi:hypothetical protein HYPSUDRAFT_49105 [Hypholoma sublateritium FD-334 SS-4]|uniref:Uncharacterized protein n=1 Tax=Hypholoma sublateritium (strain FD-334 SS-4) TaxID=945553 RepID=A0A0D2KIK6_HYPSF|nr:hypothetical protein HYPSUDRAFT_49105 [Hypholoma sublateritium FD-334 SS-4]